MGAVVILVTVVMMVPRTCLATLGSAWHDQQVATYYRYYVAWSTQIRPVAGVGPFSNCSEDVVLGVGIGVM